MNDFTKEELDDIENGLGWLCEHNPFHKVYVGKLMTKVKSMIDNYCEHELYCTCCDAEQKHIYCSHCKKSMKRIIP